MGDTISNGDLSILDDLERKALWLASWTIRNANYLRENVDGLKVGGHQASSASLATITTAPPRLPEHWQSGRCLPEGCNRRVELRDARS